MVEISNKFIGQMQEALEKYRHDVMGRADWKWDEDFMQHIPCCSVVQTNGMTCGNGPLTDEQVKTGDCGEDHDGE